MTKNTVYRCTESSGTDNIKPFQEEIPEVGNHEVLVKIKAVALNFRDIMLASGTYPAPRKDQVVPCSDAAGEVVKVGPSVQDFQVGDRVINCFNLNTPYGVARDTSTGYGAGSDGVLQEYKVFPVEELVKIPSGSHLSWGEAASLVCSGTTAWNGLFGGVRFTAGQSVLLIGTGGVAIIAALLARAAGAITIITSSSDEKLKYVKEKYGVDYTINYNTYPDWEKEVLKLTDGEGVDFVLETGGSGTVAKSIAATKNGGNLALLGSVSQAKEMPDMFLMLLVKAITARGIVVGNKQLTEELVRFVHAKKIHMPIEKEFGFSDKEVLEAFNFIQGKSHMGKTIINLE